MFKLSYNILRNFLHKSVASMESSNDAQAINLNVRSLSLLGKRFPLEINARHKNEKAFVIWFLGSALTKFKKFYSSSTWALQ